MKVVKKGFTLIEVSLFLALTGFLMLGLVIGSNVSISRQRYNDTVNSFAEYLRGVYSDVLNVSNDKIPSSKPSGEDAGRTNKAVYGKLIIVGDPDTDIHTIYSYDVIGDAVNSSELTNSNILESLQKLNANVLSYADGKNTFFKESSFVLPWEGVLEDKEGEAKHGAILVVRSPSSGSIRTFSVWFAPTAPFPYLSFRNALANGENKTGIFNTLLMLMDTYQITFCVDSPDNNYERRFEVLINKNASNSSFIEKLALDSDNNECLDKKYSGNFPGES